MGTQRQEEQAARGELLQEKIWAIANQYDPEHLLGSKMWELIAERCVAAFDEAVETLTTGHEDPAAGNFPVPDGLVDASIPIVCQIPPGTIKREK